MPPRLLSCRGGGGRHAEHDRRRGRAQRQQRRVALQRLHARTHGFRPAQALACTHTHRVAQAHGLIS
eukprot:4626204-Pleurochrysis_carterae.AAC.3